MASTSVDLCTIPAAKSPNGQYNFENPTTLAPVTFSVGAILVTISTILTIGRSYMRRRKLNSADYFTIAACVVNIAFMGDIFARNDPEYKFSRHQWDIPVCWFTASYFKILYVQTLLFAPVFFTSKAAIFLLYRQLFGVHQSMRVAINIGLVFSALLYIPNLPLSAIFDAPRLGSPWESMLTSERPKKMTIWGIVQSSTGTLLDLYIFFLPLPIISRLNMPFGRRLQILAIFTTASMGVVASALSLVYRIQLLHTTDYLWRQAIVALCALVETNVAIIVGCLPSFSKLLHVSGSALLKSLRSRLLGGSGGSNNNNSGNKQEEERPKVATFGSNQPPHRRRDYYELSDTMLLKSQDTTLDGGSEAPASLHDGICETLVSLLGDKVSLPGTATYNASLSSYFSLQASAVHPLCFVSPQTTSDVSVVIGSLATNSSDGSRDFAIRSGGHMWFPGGSNSPGGVTVDLRGLNSVELSADQSTVSVGVGATWDAVYARLDPLGLSVAGGRIGGVGVGGLTLGGGISYFGPRYGWTCDTASSLEVVLADGSIVEANEEQNPDLLHGLRGGSNNFGVVTRIDLRTFQQGSLWAASIYSPVSTIDDQIKIFAKLTAAENYDEYASFITGFGYSQSRGLTVIDNELIYTKPVENPPYYQEFLSLPSIYNTSSIVNATTLAQQGAKLLPPGVARRSYLFATTTFLPTEAMLRAAFDAWSSSLAGVRDISGLTWSLSLEPLPPAIYKRHAGANALGLADRTGTRVVCLLSHNWADQADDERVYAASAALVTAIEEAARGLDAYDPFVYLDYAARWQDPIASYGDRSVQKLRELRDRVDPKGVFTHLVPGGFKIPS